MRSTTPVTAPSTDAPPSTTTAARTDSARVWARRARTAAPMPMLNQAQAPLIKVWRKTYAASNHHCEASSLSTQIRCDDSTTTRHR